MSSRYFSLSTSSFRPNRRRRFPGGRYFRLSLWEKMPSTGAVPSFNKPLGAMWLKYASRHLREASLGIHPLTYMRESISFAMMEMYLYIQIDTRHVQTVRA